MMIVVVIIMLLMMMIEAHAKIYNTNWLTENSHRQEQDQDRTSPTT